MVDEVPGTYQTLFLKGAKMLTDLLAGDGMEATGPSYLQEMIRVVKATMGECLH